jgi:hypothetical protein
MAKSSELRVGVDSAVARNEKDGPYRWKVDTKGVVVMGRSLGGL